MTESLAVRAEIEKLARLLDTTPQRLDYLDALPAATIREVRHRATDVLFDADADMLGRLAAAAKLIPVSTVALAGRRFFGPLLSARIAAQLEPARAAEVAQRLSPRFLAEVCLHLDPRWAAGIIARIPVGTIVEVARELINRREYVTLGQLVGYVSEEAVTASVAVAGPEDLLRIAFFIEDPVHPVSCARDSPANSGAQPAARGVVVVADPTPGSTPPPPCEPPPGHRTSSTNLWRRTLDTVVGTLTDGRVGDVLRAAGTHDLWPYAFGLVEALQPAQRARIADIAVGLDDAVLTSMLDAVHVEELYPHLLPLVAEMSPASRRRLAGATTLHRADRLTAVIRATADSDLWPQVLPLVELLPVKAKRHVAAAAGKLPKPSLVRAIEAARDHHQWPALLTVAEHMTPATRAKLIRLFADVDGSVIESFLDAAVSEAVADRAFAVLHTVPLADLRPVTDRIAALDPAVRQRLADRARELRRLDDLGPLGAALTP